MKKMKIKKRKQKREGKKRINNKSVLEAPNKSHRGHLVVFNMVHGDLA